MPPYLCGPNATEQENVGTKPPLHSVAAMACFLYSEDVVPISSLWEERMSFWVSRSHGMPSNWKFLVRVDNGIDSY
jgi:hypothetical protein